MSSATYKRHLAFLVVALTLITALIIGTAAIFTDRVNQTVSFKVASFSKDGYTLERTAPDGYFTAGESVTTTITEKNTSTGSMNAVLTMSAFWSSPDPDCKLWGNATAANNAVLTVDGSVIPYAVQTDGTIIFDLPQNTIGASVNSSRKLTLTLPVSLKSTGTLSFSFDKAEVSRPGTQWSAAFTKEELNSREDLRFSVGIAWNISKDQSTKDVIAFLSGSSGSYGLEIIKNGKAANTNNGTMQDFTITKTADTSANKDDASKWVSSAPWYGYHAQIKSVSLPDSLTTIGSGAFLNLTAWNADLSLPNTVTSVGEAAFGNASGLTSVVIPDSVISLGTYAFTSCQGVKTIQLGSGLTALAEKVFFNNLSLESIDWGTSSITTIGKSAFERAGQKNATLLSLRFPDSVKTVGESAFANTNALKTLDLNKVQSIGKDAFASAQQLTALTIPAGVNTISQLSFYNCRSLVEITFTHGESDPLTLPDASTQQGAFRLDDEDGFTPLRTSVYTTSSTAKNYVWLKDNRLLKGDPILKKYYSNSTQDFHAYKSTISKVTVMDHYAPPASLTAGPWDVSAAGDESVMAYLAGTELFICSNVYSWTDPSRNVNTPVIANRDSAYLFEDFSSATIIDAANLITPNTTDMCGMFSGCTALQALDISNFTTSKVGDFSNMFENCQSLITLDVSHFDTSKMYSSAQMFYNCKTLTALDVSGFITANLKNMNSMFNGCSGITELDVSQFDTSSCNTMNYVFSGCSGLETLDVSAWVTDQVTNFSGLFSGCSGLTELDVSQFDTSLAEDMAGMFSRCSGLTSLDVSQFDTSQVENLDGIFSDCFQIQMLDLRNWNTETVQYMTNAFSRMRKLDTIVLGPDFIFQEADGILPAPDDSYITGANGHWYDTGSWIKYTPEEVAEEHMGTVTYTAYPPVLDSIEIVTPPDKVEYYVGEDFAPAGMEVQANYTHSDYPDHSRMLEDDEYTIPDGTQLTIGRTYITVSYTEDGVTKTDTQLITVKQAVPMLDDQDNWYDTDVDKDAITSITLVDTYDTAGKTITQQWDASDESVPNTVTAYLEDDGLSTSTYKLTLAGNGYGKIYANPDSYNAFSYFRNMTALNGLVSSSGAAFLDTSKVTTTSCMFNYDSELLSLDVSKFDTSQVTDFSYMFQGCSSLTAVDVSNFKTDKATTFEAMFAYCNDLVTVDVSNWNTANVQYLNRMFDQCYELQSLDVTGWVVQKVTTTRSMFQSCDELATLDVTNWVFTNVLTDTGYMFNGCESLPAIVVDDWVMDNVTNVTAMFQSCKLVTTLDVSNWNTGSVVYMSNMFNGCQNLSVLDVSKWDVSNAVWAEQMFFECKSLPALAVDSWNVSKIKTMAAMFYHCENLVTLNVSSWNTEALRSVTNIMGETRSDGSYKYDRGMFEACKKLAVIDISGWNMSQITNNARMFADCLSLKSLTVPASAAYISPEFAYNCTSMTEITFSHAAGATVYLPTAGVKTMDMYPEDSEDENGVYSDGGAFYVPSYLETKITTSNETIKNYDWVSDHRAKALPILASDDTWYTQGGTSVEKSSISSITLADTYDTSGKTIVSQWDASDGKVGTVTAYVEDDGLNAGTYKLTLVGNGSNVIYANKNSSHAFSFSSKLTAINNLALLDTSNTTSMYGMFEDSSGLTALDLSQFDTSLTTSFGSMFCGCSGLTALDLSSFETENVSEMSYMFEGCKALSTLDIQSFDTQNVVTMSFMFKDCKSLTNLDLRHFRTPKLQGLGYTFYGCKKLTSLDVTSFDTSNVRELIYTFQGCESLTSLDVSNFVTDKVTTFIGTFMNCEKLTSLDINHFNTSKSESFANMFQGCESITQLDISNFDTSKAESLSHMFYGCNSLTSLDLRNFNTDLVTSMYGTFGFCFDLTSLDISSFNTAAVTNMSSMFTSCASLTALDLSHFKTDNVTTMQSMFGSCFELQSLDVSSFTGTKVTNTWDMFYQNHKLSTLDLSSFNSPQLTNMEAMFDMRDGTSALRTLDISSMTIDAVESADLVFNNCSNLTVYVADAAVKSFFEGLSDVPDTVTFVIKTAEVNLLAADDLVSDAEDSPSPETPEELSVLIPETAEGQSDAADTDPELQPTSSEPSVIMEELLP